MRILRCITRLNVGGPARQVAYLHEVFNRGEDSAWLMYGALDEDEGDFSHLVDLSHNAEYLPFLVRPLHVKGGPFVHSRGA